MGDRVAKDALFDGFADIAKALANGRRAELIDVLVQGERHVEELAAEIGQSVANTSFHLRTLADAGLVVTRRDKTRIYYRCASDRIIDLWFALRDVAASVSIPVFAIGGVTPGTAPACHAAGAFGVACIHAVLPPHRAGQAIQEFRESR